MKGYVTYEHEQQYQPKHNAMNRTIDTSLRRHNNMQFDTNEP